jgi:hypothetical protein
MDFSQYIHKAELSQEEFCNLFKVSFKTFRRYKKTNRFPTSIKIALQLMANEIPFSGFDGWHFKNGLLCDPNGNRFSSGDILAIVYDRQLIRNLDKELEKLKKERKKETRKSAKIYTFPPERILRYKLAD